MSNNTKEISTVRYYGIMYREKGEDPTAQWMLWNDDTYTKPEQAIANLNSLKAGDDEDDEYEYTICLMRPVIEVAPNVLA